MVGSEKENPPIVDSSRFHRVYPNLPMMERRQVCCVLDNEPISWRVAYEEIKNNTKLGNRILEIMARMDLI